MRFFLPVLMACALLGGCSRSLIHTNFKSPDFSLESLRDAPSLLVVTPDVRVMAFEKSYRKLFKSPEALAERLSRKILDSLSQGSVYVGTAMPDSGLQNFLDSTGAKYVFYVRDIGLSDSLNEIPEMMIPEIGGMSRPSQGTSESCIVRLDVQVLDTNLVQIYAFTVRTKADVMLYAYKTAILKALDAAARKTAAHLSGR